MGNKLGWILAGGLLAIFVLVIVVFVILPQFDTTPPTDLTTAPGALDLKTADAPLDAIAGRRPSATGNAADDYYAAVLAYENNKQDLLDAVGRAETAAGIPTEGVAIMEDIHSHVAEGTKKKGMRFTTVKDDQEFLMIRQINGARRLSFMSSALKKLGDYYLANGRHEKAKSVYVDEFLMGWHMSAERSRPHMVITGIGVQREGLRGLIAAANATGDSKTAQAATDYLDELDTVSSFQREKLTWIWRADPFEYAGDVFNIIENDKDPAWRVEGILFLGVLKHTQATKKADSKHIRKLIDKYKNSSDPYEKAAAVAAERFSEQDFNRIDSISLD